MVVPPFTGVPYSNLSGVIGSSLTRLPVAWKTALAIAAGLVEVVVHLRIPCAPSPARHFVWKTSLATEIAVIAFGQPA